MIRKAVLSDTDDIVELLTAFQQKVHNTEFVDLYCLVRDAINKYTVLVAENSGVLTGVLIGRLLDNPFRGTTALQEIVWYSQGTSGGKLLGAFEAEARRLNADEVHMTVLEKSGTRVHDFMNRRGYSPLERSYVLKL